MPRYIVLTLDDAHAIATVLTLARRGDPIDASEKDRATLRRIEDRLTHETGADMQEIVDTLVTLRICAACEHEGRALFCASLDAQKLGRRLRRLLERARGERS